MTLIDRGRRQRDRSLSPLPGTGHTALLSEQVIEPVERLVVKRQFASGDLLPNQAELCEHAGVSRITVTQALVELEREGRVGRHHHGDAVTFEFGEIPRVHGRV